MDPLSFDLWMLLAAVLIGVVHVSTNSLSAKRQVGNAWTVGSRDEPRPLTGVPGRLERAARNYQETFPLFAALVLLAHVTGRADDWTAIGSALFVGGRALYLPAYASGIPWVRTIFWQVATIGLVVIGVAVAVE